MTAADAPSHLNSRTKHNIAIEHSKNKMIACFGSRVEPGMI